MFSVAAPVSNSNAVVALDICILLLVAPCIKLFASYPPPDQVPVSASVILVSNGVTAKL